MPDRHDIPYFSDPHAAPERSGAAEEPAEDSEGNAEAETAVPDAEPAADADPGAEPGTDAEPEAEPAADAEPGASSRRLRKAALVAAGAVAIVVVVLGVWVALYAHRQVLTPFIVGRTPFAAERLLDAQGLVAGNARVVATTRFAPGLIMEQSPQTPTKLKPGTPVDVVVATGTVEATVPDTFLDVEKTAQQKLRFALFVPIVIHAYSSQVDVGKIMSQLPRAGDMAFTGSPVFIVSSMGPGMPGVVAPSLIGKPRTVAASLLATETLFPRDITVDAPGLAPDTVADQTPPAGTVMPVGASVALAITPR